MLIYSFPYEYHIQIPNDKSTGFAILLLSDQIRVALGRGEYDIGLCLYLKYILLKKMVKYGWFWYYVEKIKLS